MVIEHFVKHISMFCLTRRKDISVVEKIYDRGLLDGAPVTETVPPLSPCNHSNNLMQLSFDTFSSKNSGLSIVVWQIFVIALLISCCCAFNSASKQTKALQNMKSFKIHLIGFIHFSPDSLDFSSDFDAQITSAMTSLSIRDPLTKDQI